MHTHIYVYMHVQSDYLRYLRMFVCPVFRHVCSCIYGYTNIHVCIHMNVWMWALFLKNKRVRLFITPFSLCVSCLDMSAHTSMATQIYMCIYIYVWMWALFLKNKKGCSIITPSNAKVMGGQSKSRPNISQVRGGGDFQPPPHRGKGWGTISCEWVDVSVFSTWYIENEAI